MELVFVVFVQGGKSAVHCGVSVCGVSREVTLQCIAVCQCVECLKAAVNILGDNVSALV